MINIKTGNELSRQGKVWGAILIVMFTLLPLVMLVAVWPDQLPGLTDGGGMTYHWAWFNVQLSDQTAGPGPWINFNAIVFLLVALSGFLGSMIHIGTSFGNFIGSEQFKSSWIPWYFMKPFTATGVALIMYFVLRAGLLNAGGSAQLNLYGLVTLSALAGLFTDKATIKLEEIFMVIFKPEDKRPDKLEKGKLSFNVTGVDGQQLGIDDEQQLVISGENGGNQLLKLRINNTDIPDFTIRPNGISFSYQIPAGIKGSQTIPLQLFDESDRELFRKNIRVTS